MKQFYSLVTSFLCFAVFSFCNIVNAQTFYRVTNTSGTQSLGGTAVTITPVNSPATATAYCTDSGPYWIGQTFGPNVSGYKFAFSPYAGRVKIQVEAIDSAETVSVYINGTFYDLSSSTITALPCSSSANIVLPVVVSGSLTSAVSNTVDGFGIVDINPGYPIDSIRIMKGGVAYGGVVHNLYFARDTFVMINQPFIDTALCAGDSLYLSYKVSNKFKNPNTFTAQLSNASGSFASPVNIGFRTFDTSGVIPCVIPASTTFGTGYRIRIVSSNPIKTSLDDGKNIVIGNVYPSGVTASNNGPVCVGSTLTLSASSTTPGVTYSWRGPNSFNSTTQNPSIGSTTIAANGDYIVSAILNGCAVKDTTTATVNIVPATPSASNNSPICIGSNIILNASSSTPGVAYSWTGPSSFASTLQNPVIVAATSVNVGVYSVTASLNGCISNAATTTVSSLVAGPTVLMYPSPNDSICTGKNVTFTAVPINPGISPTYQWLINGNPIIGANAITYTATGVNDGDAFSVLLTPGTGSACSSPVNSTSIRMTVLQYQTPSVTISASDTIAWPGVLINFIATPNNGGALPQYQWKINGKNVVGAISNIWGTPTLSDGDGVSVEMTSSYMCSSPQKVSAYKIVHIPTGINDVNNRELRIYPNPAHSELNIEGISKGTAIQLYDVFGREVYNGQSTTDKAIINLSHLTAGNYVLQLTSADGERTVVKVNKE